MQYSFLVSSYELAAEWYSYLIGLSACSLYMPWLSGLQSSLLSFPFSPPSSSTDDLSEERLKELWIGHKKATKPAQDPLAQEPLEQEPLAQEPLAQEPQNVPVLTLNEDQEVLIEVLIDRPEPQQEDLVQEESGYLYAGFSEEPFVKAAAMFRNQEYLGIIELLTKAVETGEPV